MQISPPFYPKLTPLIIVEIPTIVRMTIFITSFIDKKSTIFRFLRNMVDYILLVIKSHLNLKKVF